MEVLARFYNAFSNARFTYLLQGYAEATQENHKRAFHDGSYYAFLMR